MTTTTASLGIWTRQQALQVISRGRVQAALRRGDWVELWPCTYADAGYTLTAEQRAVAAVVAAGGLLGPRLVNGRKRLTGFAFGRTAARVLSLPLIDDDDPATGSTEHVLEHVGGWSGGGPWTHPQPDGPPRVLRRHRPTLMDGDLVQRESGLWTTSVLRTLVDCASLVSPESLACMLDHALHHHLVSIEQVAAAVVSRSWCPGTPLLTRSLALADRRAETPVETLARLLLLPALPDLVPQVVLHDPRGRSLARFDLGDVRRRFAVETDGRRAHAGEAMVAKDQRRDRASTALGWHTERCTWFDVRRRQAELVERTLAAARRHVSRPPMIF